MNRSREALVRLVEALDFPGPGAEKSAGARLRVLVLDHEQRMRVIDAEAVARAALEADEPPARPLEESMPAPWMRPMLDTNERWRSLAATFPSLRSEPFVDAMKLGLMVNNARGGAYTSNKRHAVMFACGLWPGWRGYFDVVSAMGAWDDAHKTAFRAWCAAPWWP